MKANLNKCRWLINKCEKKIASGDISKKSSLHETLSGITLNPTAQEPPYVQVQARKDMLQPVYLPAWAWQKDMIYQMHFLYPNLVITTFHGCSTIKL